MSKMFGRIIKVSINNQITFSNDDLEIRFEVPFDDDPKPNDSKIQIFNLSSNTLNRIKKNEVCTLQAGYKGDYGILSSGKITRIYTEEDGVDKITTIFVREGEDLSHKKITSKYADPAEKYKEGKKKGQSKEQAMKISFKKGTDAKTIIQKLCSALEIKLAQLELPKNVIYPKGLVVTGNLENKLEEVVKDCKASLYYRRGKMVIRSILLGTDERFVLNENTGLMGSPERFDDDSGKGYKVKCLLQHRITTASIIQVESRTTNGKYRARKGIHICNGNEFLTDVEVI